MKYLILGYGLLGAEIHRQTGWPYLDYPEIDVLQVTPQQQFDCDILINCTGYTKTYDDDQLKHMTVNYFGVKRLVDWCNENNKKLVHISTDYLYAGSVENASEGDLPVPVKTWYGLSKLLADYHVMFNSQDWLICRGTHKLYPFPYEIAWINQTGNFDYVNVIAKLIIKLIEKKAKGIYNVGTERKTMYDLAMRTVKVKPANCPVDEVPKNVTMNVDKLNKFLCE